MQGLKRFQPVPACHKCSVFAHSMFLVALLNQHWTTTSGEAKNKQYRHPTTTLEAHSGEDCRCIAVCVVPCFRRRGGDLPPVRRAGPPPFPYSLSYVDGTRAQTPCSSPVAVSVLTPSPPPAMISIGSFVWLQKRHETNKRPREVSNPGGMPVIVHVLPKNKNTSAVDPGIHGGKALR